jgi:transcriptional regulator with XRE-family HTH domain
MIDEEVGDLISQLKVWMKDEDRTEAYLAKKLGISKQRLNGWMLGTSRPNLEAFLQIKEFLRKNRVGTK